MQMVTMCRMTRLLPDPGSRHPDDGSEKGRGAPWPFGSEGKHPRHCPPSQASPVGADSARNINFSKDNRYGAVLLMRLPRRSCVF